MSAIPFGDELRAVVSTPADLQYPLIVLPAFESSDPDLVEVQELYAAPDTTSEGAAYVAGEDGPVATDPEAPNFVEAADADMESIVDELLGVEFAEGSSGQIVGGVPPIPARITPPTDKRYDER